MNRNKQKDLQKLEEAFWQHICINKNESLGLDGNAPFGGRIVIFDILEIIGAEKQKNGTYSNEVCEYCRRLYFEDLIPYLKSRYGGKMKAAESVIEIKAQPEIEEDDGLPFQ